MEDTLGTTLLGAIQTHAELHGLSLGATDETHSFQLAITRGTPDGKYQMCVILPETTGQTPTSASHLILKRISQSIFLIRETELSLEEWKSNIEHAAFILESFERAPSSGSSLAV